MKRLLTVLTSLVLLLALLSCSTNENLIGSNDSADYPNYATLQTAKLGVVGDLVSATLYLYVDIESGQQVDVHRVTADWGECAVTHNSFGGAYDAGIEGSFMADGMGWRSVEITGLVAGWLAGDFDNFGLLLNQDAEDWPRAQYQSREGYFPPFLEIVHMDGDAPVYETVYPDADVFLYAYAPDDNFCSYDQLWTGAWSSVDYEKQSLIQFDLPITPPDDCEECDGKVTELTMAFLGDAPAYIEVFGGKGHHLDKLLFSGMVDAGATFDFVGKDKHGEMGTEIKIYVDGSPNTKIHTSCSRPIGPGLISGDFEVITGRSRNGGLLCPVENEPPDDNDCEECDGKVTELTMAFLGDVPAYIEVHGGKGHRHHKLLFSGMVGAGATFDFTGKDKHGEMGTEIKISVDGSLNTKIHTSCSRPIGPGLISGDFEVITGRSRNGGLLCPVENEDPGDDGWCDMGKPQTLTVKYTGDDCDATSHTQAPDKVSCDGDPDDASLVWIIATDKRNPDDHKAKIWFDGQVALGDTFVMDARNGGKDRLSPNLYAFIMDTDGTILQSVMFHASCSQPLNEGDQFGSLLMEGMTVQ